MEPIFSLPEPCITALVLACYMPKGFRGNHIHKNRPSHGIAYFAEGKNRYVFSDGTVCDLQQGQLIYLPRGSSYTVQGIEPTECYAINFQIDTDTVFAPLVLRVDDPVRMRSRFSLAAKAWEERDTGYRLQVRALLYEILYFCHLRYRTPHMEQQIPYIIRKGVAHLNAHYTDPDLTIPYLAQLCNVSDTYFRSQFRHAFGMPPIRYLNQRRMELAKRLLIAKEHTVSEIQQLCGFRDACRFSREFKKHYGVSPSAYLYQADTFKGEHLK